ncbi:FliI/YscN family ATPase [Pinirhizobacter sp.]|jgi:type III secretion protein N (ATPase)|uniref:FliI/YscN family ATPase n=1 Tax=Pinirhizobacter sp. TaxID=2950432 RepID=UPI002F42F14F
MQVPLPSVVLGERCDVRDDRTGEVLARAQVTALNADLATMTVLGASHGFGRRLLVTPTARPLDIVLSADVAGSVLDGGGSIVERLAPSGPQVMPLERRPVHAYAPAYQRRRPVSTCLPTGVRAIDAMLSCGRGQRMGIFATAGTGKTTLVKMILDHADADITVIALVGERGREVAEFVAEAQRGGRAARTVIVQATSDTAPADRVSAALVATTVAEYFRDQGKNVLLVVDSLTRYARALRDLALASGEPPARRGYPASVFEVLPSLVERAGNVEGGSITAFYTALVEDEVEIDPVSEELRSLLDGHIVLSSKLAAEGQHPAIDILNSLSRLQAALVDAEHAHSAAIVRKRLARIRDLRLLIELGEYQAGRNGEDDRAMGMREAAESYFRQAPGERATWTDLVEDLHALAR